MPTAMPPKQAAAGSDDGGHSLRALWDAIDAAGTALFGGGCDGNCCGSTCQGCEDEMSPEEKAARLADAIDDLCGGAEVARDCRQHSRGGVLSAIPAVVQKSFGKYYAAVAVLEAAELAELEIPADVLPLVEAPEQTEVQMQASSGTGKGCVPCAKYAELVVSGATTLEGLLTADGTQRPSQRPTAQASTPGWKPSPLQPRKGEPLVLSNECANADTSQRCHRQNRAVGQADFPGPIARRRRRRA